MNDIFNDIEEERERQDKKFGEQNWPDLDPVLVETRRGPSRHADDLEIPTAIRAKQLVGFAAARKELCWGKILVEEVAEAVEAAANKTNLREELIQVAAVAVAWIEAIERRCKHKFVRDGEVAGPGGGTEEVYRCTKCGKEECR